MIRVLSVTDSLTLSGSFWRSGGPFSELQKEFPDIHITWVSPQQVYNDEIAWPVIRQANWVFMHRPATAATYQFYLKCKDLGAKVWIDIDDHLLNIPLDNETSAFYNAPEVHKAIMHMIQTADVVTASTPFLVDVIDQIRAPVFKTKDTILLPNGIPVEWWNKIRSELLDRTPDKKPVIMWRGSKHHQKDLMYYADEVVAIANKYPKVHWSFIGYCPFFICEKMKFNNWDHRPPTDVVNYFKALLRAKPDATIVPLWDCEFNYAKSNIAWLESLMAGAVCMGPGWPHWDHIGMQGYRPGDRDSFRLMLDQVCSELSEDGAANEKWEFVDMAWDKACEHYSVQDFNAQIRKPIFEGNIKAALGTAQIYSAALYPKHINIFEKQELQNGKTYSTNQGKPSGERDRSNGQVLRIDKSTEARL